MPSECLHTKHTRICRPIQHLGTKWAHQPIYQYIYIHQMPQSTTHGASRAPPPAPPLGGGGPPPPALGGGGPPPVGPSYPDDSHPVVNAATTAAHCTMARHGGGTPTHCSRKVSPWMRDHMPSGTSCNIISRR
jgi:hypothetical protein